MTMTTTTAAQRRGLRNEELPVTRNHHHGASDSSNLQYVTHQPVPAPVPRTDPASLASSAELSGKNNTGTDTTSPQYFSIHRHFPETHDYDDQSRAPPRPFQPEQVMRPARTRSRLRKRPSQRSMNSTTMHAPLRRSIDQDALTALPQLQSPAGISDRTSSMHRRNPSTGTDRPKTAKEKSSRVDKSLVDNNKSLRNPHTTLPTRPKTAASENHSNGELQVPPLTPSPTSSTSPTRSPASGNQRIPRHVALAPNDPSPLNPLYHKPSPPLLKPDFVNSNEDSPMSTNTISPAVHATKQLVQYAQLHPNFKPGTTTHHTDVSETFHPVVTQEVIKEHTVEILQEEITREIHVHHYFTQIQPIRALEVLPARHFLVDPETGEKTEIPEPEGWTMPANLQPRTPDTSILAPITRHYLVNEQHPNGVSEPPPKNSRRKSAEDLKLLANASHKAKWSPFPKTAQKGNRP